MIERYVLFTNLQYVIVNGVQTMTNALVLSENEDLFVKGKKRHLLRGFGTDSAWPTFDIAVPSFEYDLHPAIGGPIMMSDKEAEPLFKGAHMVFKLERIPLESDPVVTLLVQNNKSKIAIDEFSGEPKDSPITRVFAVLPARVEQFWKAPNMPRLTWGPPRG